MAAQVSYATLNYHQCKKLALPNTPPSVALLIVGYRENEGYWEKCLNSILETEYTNISVVSAFVDGREEEDRYMSDIFHRVMLEENKFTNYIELCEHKGKRYVLERGFRYIKNKYPDNEYIIVVDSDTIIRPDAIGELVKCVHADKQNACATGTIKIFNLETILAKIINARYLYAFLIERGAQSFAGCMSCCSGPFSIYRQNVLNDELLEDFINDRFCGELVNAGDDRTLTNLLLQQGYFSRQTPFAIAITETPDNIPRYLIQQTRWSRSALRCLKFQVDAIGKHHLYLMMVTIYEILFPFLIIISFLPTFNIITQGDHVLFHRILTALGVLTFRTFLLTCFNNFDIRSSSYNMFVFPLYFILLLPIKIYAWCTPWSQAWLTSSRKTIFTIVNWDVIMVYLSVIIWDTILILCIYFRFMCDPLFNPLKSFF